MEETDAKAKRLAYRREYYKRNIEQMRQKNCNYRSESYYRNLLAEQAKAKARYHYKKGNMDTAKQILQNAGLEPPATWNFTTASITE